MLKLQVQAFPPFFAWLKEYNAGILKMDIVAGVTMAPVLILQSMPCAQLAGSSAYVMVFVILLTMVLNILTPKSCYA